MNNQNDPERFIQGPASLRGEDDPDVEGHVRKEHAAREVLGDDGPPSVRSGAESIEEDGPDVEGHARRD